MNIDQTVRKIPFNMRMDPALRERLYAASESTGMQVTEIVEDCLREYLETVVVARSQRQHAAALRLMEQTTAYTAGKGAAPEPKIVTSETLPNVEPDARDRVRDGALRAKRIARGKKS